VTAVAESRTPPGPPVQAASLVDLLDRLLGVGVVLSGDVTICLAGVDLVTVKLRALVTSVKEAGP
jgi:gas vesicle protein GvpA/GvpJ/GvpM family